MCLVAFTITEAVVFFRSHDRLRKVAGEHADVITPVDPVSIRFPVGSRELVGEISRDSVPVLGNAYAAIGSRLKFAGLVAGLLVPLLLSGVLLLISPTSQAAFWSLLFLPLNGFASIGPRGVAKDRVKVGEIYAFLNQLFVGGFTIVSLLTVLTIQGLRFLDVLP